MFRRDRRHILTLFWKVTSERVVPSGLDAEAGSPRGVSDRRRSGPDRSHVPPHRHRVRHRLRAKLRPPTASAQNSSSGVQMVVLVYPCWAKILSTARRMRTLAI